MAEANPICPNCGSYMWSDYDYANRVRVYVCTKPTCLYRVYPDYPRRASDEEICYLCGRIFKDDSSGLGMLCPECKERVRRERPRQTHKHKKHAHRRAA